LEISDERAEEQIENETTINKIGKEKNRKKVGERERY
jgi:hypothetical protein